MKKMAMSVLAAFVVLCVGAGAKASAAPAHTDVTGVVTSHFMPVAGATVTAVCMGNTETDTTDAAGSYLVSYLAAQCPFGSTVRVTAAKGGQSGTASGTVEGKTTKLNLAIVNVSIPEYGLIGALAAGGLGIGLVALTRRQHQAQQ